MPAYSIVMAALEHAHEMAPRMRAADVEEVAAFGRTPLDALVRSIRATGEAYAGQADGHTVCIFGVSMPSLMSDTGSPWLLATDEMVRHAPAFLRMSSGYMAGLRLRFRVLHNYVGARNAAAIRWLGWLGFTVSEECIQIGDNKTEMRRFEFSRDV